MLFLTGYIAHRINVYWVKPGRKERYTITLENVRIRARIFASKNEYLQNGKLDDDIREIYKNLDIMEYKQRPVSTGIDIMVSIPKFLSFIMRLGLYIWFF